ncbi:response regulator transcription factor [Parvularcula sp. ZS-1/3]|uniref:Response regulator transcription factor n=1 Tax=Parvularcula mediterranea TaxID=2732508 RepID=A0A7Y3RK82_9PROT|nr:response regulator transcription factor [Parvularcula mediterranea]NNU15556.1 response regulator transcription factor [Parvularcula mediterranea]
MVAPIVIADDHPLFRAALVGAVGKAAPEREVIERETLEGAFAALEAGPVGLLTLDLHMPDSDGLAGLLQVRSLYPAVPVLVVSGDTAPGLPGRAAALGASGFVPKSSDLPTIREAVEAVLDGETWLPEEAEPSEEDAALASLTPTQLKVLVHVRDGLLNKQIAYELDISEATVKAHMTAVMQKLGVQTRTQAAMMARRLDVKPSERSED